MATAKAPPSALNTLLHGTGHETHRDFGSSPPSSSSSSAAPAFRSYWPRAAGGSDDDFGRFASPSPPTLPPSIITPIRTPGEIHKPRIHYKSARDPALWRLEHANETEQRTSAARDGADVLALLGPSAQTSLADEVHGDWAAELASSQAQPWRVDQETRVPRDPPADVKGKGRAGSSSPTSAELLSSISSLDLQSMQYLKTLLAGSPEESVRNYLDRGSYADDVYGIPHEVRDLLEKAQGGDQSREEGRFKAVKRLQMVMKHLWGDADEAQASDQPAVALEQPRTTLDATPRVPREMGSADWARELEEETSRVVPAPTPATATHDQGRTQDVPVFGSEGYQPLSGVRAAYQNSLAAAALANYPRFPNLGEQRTTDHLKSPALGADTREFAYQAAQPRVSDDHFSHFRATGAGDALADPRQTRDGEGDDQHGPKLPPFQDFLKTRVAAMGGSPGL